MVIRLTFNGHSMFYKDNIMKKQLSLDELQVYQLSMDVGEKVWNIVIRWNYFAKDSMGKQWVKAVDSVAANISEGYGRFFYKENRQFVYYARGSLFEAKTWLTKAYNRNLIAEEDFKLISRSLNNIGVKLNNYLKSIGKSPLQEPD